MKQNKPQNHSVLCVIKILEFLAISDGPVELKTISQLIKMNKSTIYRFLVTLMEEGYVHQDLFTRKYSLGSKVTWLAANYLEKIEVRSLARPLLQEPTRSTGETSHMAILDRNEVSYIEKIDGNQAVRMASRVGTRTPVHCTALGKVLLSSRPEGEWKHYVAEVGLSPRTPFTILDPDVFYEEICRVRSQGHVR
jgi:DNA-binding IclR family transcriptional regulator